jgi:type VI secretion system protein ImpM
MGRFIYGKHPAFGDFVTAGLSGVAQDRIEAWLNNSLQSLRTAWGEAWEQGFDSSPPLGFWVGSRIAGQAALRGAMIPSRDKVGRRFPLLAGHEGAGPLPPAVDPRDTDFCAGIAGILAEMSPDPVKGAKGMMELLPEVEGEDVDPDPAFWAARDDGDTPQLWADVAFADHLRAAHGRSYWWVMGNQTALYATESLPPPEALAWLMTGGRPVENTPPADDADQPAAVEVE